MLAVTVASEGDRFTCTAPCVGVRYVLRVGGDFAERVCHAEDRGGFIRSEMMKRIEGGIPFKFNVTMTRHSVAGCNTIRRNAGWDKNAPDSGIQIAVVISNELHGYGAIQIAPAGALEYANYFTSDNSTLFRYMLDEGVVEVRATVITPTANETTNETVVYDVLGPLLNATEETSAPPDSTIPTSTSAPPDSTTTIPTSTSAPLYSTTAIPTSTSAPPPTTSAPIFPGPSIDRSTNNQFSGDDLFKEFQPQVSAAAILIINLSLVTCSALVALL
jgi:hypothetical protein